MIKRSDLLAHMFQPKFRIIFWALLSTVLLISISYVLWLTYLRPQTQVLSGINMYRHQIVVKQGTTEIRLDPFETYHFSVNTNSPIEITAYSASGDVLATHTHTGGNSAGLGMDFWAEADVSPECIVSATATDVYYPGTNQKFDTLPPVINAQIIAPEAPNQFYTHTQPHKDQYVFLDTYNGKELPTTIAPLSDVIGYYFVPCADTADTDKLQNWAAWWLNYDAADQLMLYSKELAKLRSTAVYK